MGLIERLKKIAEEQEIPLDDVGLKRAEVFLGEHIQHGAMEIIMGVNDKGIKYVRLGCGSEAFYSVEVYKCREE